MERQKYIFIIACSLVSYFSFGQNNQAIYNAYIHGNMEQWKYSIDSLERAKARTNIDRLNLINYQYGYIAWCIDQDKDTDAEAYISKAENHIDLLEKQNYSLSFLYAYKAAIVGFQIGISIYKAPFIGAQSVSHAEKSLSLDSLNPFAYIQLGNIAFYTPKMFGGSKPEAIQYYLRALNLMEEDQEGIKHNWNYLNLLVTIVNAYIEFEEFDKAKSYCIKTLNIEPEFEWVKNNLYPELLKKMQS